MEEVRRPRLRRLTERRQVAEQLIGTLQLTTFNQAFARCIRARALRGARLRDESASRNASRASSSASAIRPRSSLAIAQALFVTRATVESHLHPAYHKLGIQGRSDLATALNGA